MRQPCGERRRALPETELAGLTVTFGAGTTVAGGVDEDAGGGVVPGGVVGGVGGGGGGGGVVVGAFVNTHLIHSPAWAWMWTVLPVTVVWVSIGSFGPGSIHGSCPDPFHGLMVYRHSTPLSA